MKRTDAVPHAAALTEMCSHKVDALTAVVTAVAAQPTVRPLTNSEPHALTATYCSTCYGRTEYSHL